MQKKRRRIARMLLFINLLVLMVAVAPHHHHEGTICIRHDIASAEAQCPPQQHQSDDDGCCNDDCLTHFYSPTPSEHADTTPLYIFLFTLFTAVLIERLLRLRERRVKPDYVFQESLYGTESFRSVPLRAPPARG